ncbi:MAG: rRNA pseudouridine synthase [Clostridiales bacterium]|nr:rRNA pseudouridine synthase [Candidatus Equinaster intestinalis]
MKTVKIRLQKHLSECGVASRRKAEELIAAGKVKVNGHIAHIGDSVDPKRDKITVSGKKVVNNNTEKVYIMLHKPRGFVTTLSDEKGRRCVADLVKDVGVRLFPVGRLDKDSEGLLFMTNDGDFANKLTHPSSFVNKTYRVTVSGAVDDEQLDKLCSGIVLDGVKTAPCDVFVAERKEDRTVLIFIIHEGRNRQIRRMCEAVKLSVIRLKRTEIAGVKLGMLSQGKWRNLNEKELHRLNSISVSRKEED